MNSSNSSNSSPSVQYNPEQLKAIELSKQGASFTLQGTAGSGKTTVSNRMISDAIASTPCISLGSDHKFFPEDAPAVLVVAYTNAALNTTKNRAPIEERAHYMTIHKALEYTLVDKVKVSPEGDLQTTQVFEPRRTIENQLEGIQKVFIDEATLPNMELFYYFKQALPKDVQIIYIGDLNQQEPPFGKSVLAYQSTRIPAVVLTQTYRQAEESPVLSLLHDLISGEIVNASPEGFKAKYAKSNEHGEVHINYFKPKIPQEAICTLWDTKELASKFISKYQWSQYDDVIIIPYNKQFGTTLLNKHINSYWSLKNQQETHEVVAGFQYMYFAVGDYVLHENRPCIVQAIEPLANHKGRSYAQAKVGMPRGREDTEGVDPEALKADPFGEAERSEAHVERSVSHSITLYDTEMDLEYTVSAQGAVAKLIGAHAITSYKSQGRQWHRVFVFVHNSHKNLNREMMYTMLSRTEFSVYMQIEVNTFTITKNRQSIKGDSPLEKLDWLHDNPVATFVPPVEEEEAYT